MYMSVQLKGSISTDLNSDTFKQDVALGQSYRSIFWSIQIDQSDCSISRISVKNSVVFTEFFLLH